MTKSKKIESFRVVGYSESRHFSDVLFNQNESHLQLGSINYWLNIEGFSERINVEKKIFESVVSKILRTQEPVMISLNVE